MSAAPPSMETDEYFIFPRERPGLDYDLNWYHHHHHRHRHRPRHHHLDLCTCSRAWWWWAMGQRKPTRPPHPFYHPLCHYCTIASNINVAAAVADAATTTTNIIHHHLSS